MRAASILMADSRFKEFHEEIKGDIRFELQRFFEQYMGHVSATAHGSSTNKGKGILGGTPPGFQPKESLLLSLIVEFGHVGLHLRWSNLEQFFKVEGVQEQDKGTVDHFHDQFVSILNQLHLPKTYALSVFISNLKVELGQYLSLFKSQTLAEGYLLDRQMEGIVVNILKKTILSWGSGGHPKPLFSSSKITMENNHSPTIGGPATISGRSKAPTKPLSQAEMEDRKKTGLCF
ncbi:hypothetical protein CXB51_034925 [Gossypium anomalum]|uniref:Uncharacterized protein n=1 Tax=Gossypium anomalum TaxID=47600 RepID=A0A8J5XNL7_9ROSI|nr:hypothetical protein CXB51_034925 [Gossypium anomalum]